MTTASAKAPKLHFDCAALCREVQQQDIGLRINTNDPAGFRRVLYKHMRAHPADRIFIYQAADAPNALLLLNQQSPDLKEAENA